VPHWERVPSAVLQAYGIVFMFFHHQLSMPPAPYLDVHLKRRPSMFRNIQIHRINPLLRIFLEIKAIQ
jgi:hypothetical protein